ncbi:CoxG family protein [Pedococcus sp. 5OH_020]|uniref:CoxG family protein n=1 Tax=Pedococcus sp. 5OH_020 TaxID=2989814 RepID=UPI0022E9B31F|nr:SRPBCC domain-containing protein [Pedococcus sp. 5OH_020]
MTSTRRADWSKRTAKKPPGAEVALEDVLELPVTPQTAWRRLDDVPLVAACIPGLDPATLVDMGQGVYRATMTNTVMGITANWDLEATIRPLAATKTLSVQLRGEDPKMRMKLDGHADVVVTSGADGGALLRYEAQLRVEGSLAAMGGPVIRTILADTITQFVQVVSGEDASPRRSLLGRLLDRLTQRWRRIFNVAEGRA